MATSKYECTLKVKPTAKNICAKTGIVWTIESATDEQIEKMIKAGNSAWKPVAKPVKASAQS